MIDYIVLGVVAIIIILAGIYVYKAKKNGIKCIGCADCKGHHENKKITKSKDFHSDCNCGSK